MALNHGINTTKAATNRMVTTQGAVGIPVFIGCAPVHMGAGFKGIPQIAYGFAEAKELLGYSDAWTDASGNPKWNLCEAMYSHFALFGQSPAVFINVFDPATNKTAVAAASMTVTDHKVVIGEDAILDSGLTVTDGEDALPATDYTAYYGDGGLTVELLATGASYAATTLVIGYNKIDLTAITATVINGAIEQIEQCKTRFGIVPDLLCAPGWSKVPEVAAVMAAKAASINGLFRGKAVVDLNTAAAGADDYADVGAYKAANGYTDPNMIVCWPLAKVGDKVFNMSTIVCGKLAQVDADNGNVPFESPSNKGLPITGCVNAAGAEILLTVTQADVVSYTAGVVTAINYDGWVVWGNYTGCHPGSTDVAEIFICTNRMMDFVCNTFTHTFWGYLDRPLTRVLIDAIVNSFNTWLAGLVRDGALYGGEIAYVEENNQTDDLIAGKFRLDTVVAAPVPAQRIDMVAEFDVDILVNAING